MSTVAHRPAQAPASICVSCVDKHQDTPDRWRQALQRAQDAGIRVYQLAPGRWAVTSGHDPAKAYEVTCGSRGPQVETCTCPAAAFGDPVCAHRAAVRAHLHPHPEPPAHTAYNPTAEAIQWAQNDLARAHRDLDRLNAKLARDGRLSDADYAASLRAQDRAADAWERINEATARLAAKQCSEIPDMENLNIVAAAPKQSDILSKCTNSQKVAKAAQNGMVAA